MPFDIRSNIGNVSNPKHHIPLLRLQPELVSVSSQVIMSARFTYYYPENGGYLHCRILGTGAQGTATLVRSVRDGECYVRKKAWSDGQHSGRILCGEVEFYRQHDHIPRLIHAESFINRDSPPPVKLNTLIFPFCNVGDLVSLYDRCGHSPTKVPEVLILRCLGHLLKTITFLHFECNIKHNDLSPGNVLVNIANNEQFPKFFLADFGVAENLSADPEEMRGQIQEDLSELRITISFLLSGSMEPVVSRRFVEKHYSSQLLRSYNMLRELLKPGFELKTYHAKMRDLRRVVDRALELQQRTSGVDLSFLRPKDESLLVKTFYSKDELLRARKLPPGPWQIAKIDMATGKVSIVDSQKYQEKRWA